MNKAITDAAANIGLKLAEQNISSIEKMHNKIKIKRYIGTHVLIALGLIVSGGISTIAFVVDFIYIIACALAIFIVLGCLIFQPYITNAKSYIEKIGGFSIVVSTNTVFIALLIGYTRMYNDNILDYIVESTFAFSVISLIVALIFSARITAPAIVTHLYPNDYKVRVMLYNSHIVEGHLITITNKGDYVVRITQEDEKTKEILVKLNSVATVELE